MDEQEFSSLKAVILENRVVTPADLEKVLHDCGQLEPESNTKFRFYLMRCTRQGFRDVDLIKFMLARLVSYVLQKKEYHDIQKENVRDLYLAAKETFVANPNSGEAGELLLFLFLEGSGAVQLFSKMDLKTNPNMHVHGYDALHIEVGNNVIFHFGHSKMYADLNRALTDAVGDIEKFELDRVQRDRELRLVSSHIDESKFGNSSETIRAMLNPYSEHREKYAEVNSIFLGADWAFARPSELNPGADVDGYMKEEYEARKKEVASGLSKKILSKKTVGAQKFLIFLLPFVDVEDFRQKFQAELER